MSRPQRLDKWFSSLIEKSNFRVVDSSLAASKTWVLSGGQIRHHTGRFFKVVGVRWSSPSGEVITRPLLEQHEIGTLGFMMRRVNDKNEVLMQAKLEPGNIGVVQLAPTCQATASNISQVHGGSKPPFCEWFKPGDPNIVHESLQSEQGSRFLGKRNRNVLSIVNQSVPNGFLHSWLPVEKTLDLLTVDYLVNSDARSVLVCGPWEQLVGREPFSKYRSGFGRELSHSYQETKSIGNTKTILDELRQLRLKVAAPAIVGLDNLDGWKITDGGVAPISKKPFVVRQIKVTAALREVPTWDQPIIDSSGEGRIDLLCGRIDGVLHFLFRPHIEPGLENKVELGPSMVIEPGDTEEGKGVDQYKTVVRTECSQSEEGGRFYRDTNRYRVVDVGEAFEAPPTWNWLTLRQIRKLLDEGGWLTNEARSALSLLLIWL